MSRADLGEHLTHRGHLSLGVGVRPVDDVDDKVGVGHLLQRRPERLDELVRQMAHEAHRVGQREDAAVAGRRTPSGGVEGGEERVLDEDAGAGQPVQQRRLAGVGVARDDNAGDLAPDPLGLLGDPGGLHVLQLAAQLRHPGGDATTVGLELGLTRSAPTDTATLDADTATGLPRKISAPPPQPLFEVLELRQLDLRLALLGTGVLGEDVQDQRGPVDDLRLHTVLEVAQL